MWPFTRERRTHETPGKRTRSRIGREFHPADEGALLESRALLSAVTFRAADLEGVHAVRMIPGHPMLSGHGGASVSVVRGTGGSSLVTHVTHTIGASSNASGINFGAVDGGRTVFNPNRLNSSLNNTGFPPTSSPITTGTPSSTSTTTGGLSSINLSGLLGNSTGTTNTGGLSSTNLSSLLGGSTTTSLNNALGTYGTGLV